MKLFSELRVNLGERSYPIFVGSSLLRELSDLVAERGFRGWKKAVVVTDLNVGALYLETLLSELEKMGIQAFPFQIPPGEKSKSLQMAYELLKFLANSSLSRRDLVVALGGGVVGDLAGFASCVFKRGTDFLVLPTSLVAQVDSSIGGKTGVNLPEGKNLVGAFYQPVAVVSDVDVLETLPQREYLSSLAEVAKYSFLKPNSWKTSLAELSRELLERQKEALLSVVATSAGIKAHIVSEDEWDIKGKRAILNYGHTLGHALEAATEYGTYLHGEAVSVGMLYAACISEELMLSEGLSARHQRLLSSLSLPLKPLVAPPFDRLFTHMLQDKKAAGEISMVLLESEGKPLIKSGIERELLEECYASFCGGEST
ncbi:MAG: 3-dehydroquinate synthase [Actinomycetota bacterium]|nr:3-dehydroquinate synthase [Actinomycetota bacterium]